MPLAELIEYVKAGGGISAPLLLIALIWMNKDREKAHSERLEAIDKYEKSNEKLQNLSEKTLVLLTEIKGLFGNRHV